MRTAFLSFAFRSHDRSLVTAVEKLLASHDITTMTGGRLGGEPLTQAIQDRIAGADGLIALLTRRDNLVSGGWTTHQWVRDELNHARTIGKRAIALVEDGVDVGGAYLENERITLERRKLHEALLALSETIGLWKRESGRLLKIRILPEELAQSLPFSTDHVSCQYRIVSASGSYHEWKEASLVPEIGGTFVYVPGVCNNDDMIQLQIERHPLRWRSVAVSQWFQAELSENR